MLGTLKNVRFEPTLVRDGRELELFVRVTRHTHSGADVYSTAVANPGAAPLEAGRVRLFEIDLGVSELRAYQEGYYMPATPRVLPVGA